MSSCVVFGSIQTNGVRLINLTQLLYNKFGLRISMSDLLLLWKWIDGYAFHEANAIDFELKADQEDQGNKAATNFATDWAD